MPVSSSLRLLCRRFLSNFYALSHACIGRRKKNRKIFTHVHTRSLQREKSAPTPAGLGNSTPSPFWCPQTPSRKQIRLAGGFCSYEKVMSNILELTSIPISRVYLFTLRIHRKCDRNDFCGCLSLTNVFIPIAL